MCCKVKRNLPTRSRRSTISGRRYPYRPRCLKPPRVRACRPNNGEHAARRAQRTIRRRWSENWTLGLFVLPALLVLVVSQLYPLGYSLYLSLVDWALARSPTPGGFVGLANYTKALGDPVFRHAFGLSALIAIVATVVEVCVGTLFALLTVGERRSVRVVRTVLLLPMVVAPVAVGTLWRMLLNARSGLVNVILGALHLPTPDWLGAPGTALAAVVGVEIWQWTPFVMVILVAALSALPHELYEAAAVDGAGRGQMLRAITLPLLVPVLVLVTMFRLVDAFMILDAVYTTTFGGPGFSTTVLTFYIYQQGLRYYNISYAAAASWLLLLTSLLAATLLLWVRRRAQG